MVLQINKILGYVLSGVGLVFIALTSFPQAKTLIEKILKAFSTQVQSSVINTILIIGLALVGVGLIIIFREGNSKKQFSEVPIYEGHGKKRTIVGIQRFKK